MVYVAQRGSAARSRSTAPIPKSSNHLYPPIPSRTKTMASIALSTRRVTSSLIRAAYCPSQQQLGCDGVEGKCLLRRHVSLSPLSSSSGQCRRKASTYSHFREMAELSEDVDPSSSLTTPGPTESMVQSFDPVKKSRARKVPLPRSR